MPPNPIDMGPTDTDPTDAPTGAPTGADSGGFDHNAARERIVAAALPHAPFDGWTREMLRLAARDAGYDDATVLRVFPRGPVEAVECWVALTDRRMIAALQAAPQAARTHERVASAIRLRLEALNGHREAARRALGLLAAPFNAAVAAASLWRTIDGIWYAAGDTATDFNYYTKRALLAGVYGATLLYWLDDRSEGSADSWDFLDRRLADAMRAPRILSGLRARLPDLSWLKRRPSPFGR